MISMAFLKQRAQDNLPDAGLAYFLMGLNAMVYLDPATYLARLQSIVSGSVVTPFPSGSNFKPGALVVADPDWAIVAVQGTQGWTPWMQYVSGAGFTQWPLRAGIVFTPFYNLATDFAARVGPLLGGFAGVTWTGHSLGAAVAPLSAEILHVDRTLKFPQFWYAQPRLADRVFSASYPGPGFQLNSPLDPIPYLPCDTLAALAANPFAIRGSDGFTGLGDPRPIGRSVGPYAWPAAGDFVAGLSASFPDLRQSPHQTYWYIRILFHYLDEANQLYYSDYTQLLTELGLTDPWPV